MNKKVVNVEIIASGSKPDFDIDVLKEKREFLVNEHLDEAYGLGHNSAINTFGTLKAKSALKSASKVYKVPLAEVNKATKSFPDAIEGVEPTLSEVFTKGTERYDDASEFRTIVSDKEVWGDALDASMALEGRIVQTGVHAAGMLMSNRKLDDVIPLKWIKDSSTGKMRYTSQWSYPECESLGLLKMDFLGLNTLDLHMRAVRYILMNGKKAPSIVNMYDNDMNDEKTYKMLQRGEGVGIFQLEGAQMQELLRRVAPTNIDDITAIIALYRPGPLGVGSHTLYADRKNKRVPKGVPVHEDFVGSPLEELLSETHNVIIYQEQIMQISNQVAGMTLQEGDDLRRVVSKKKAKEMALIKPRFVSGGVNNGYSEEAMNVLWDVIEQFAKYGFNKSHSVAYAYLAYASSYLKAHFPVEFMSATVAQNNDHPDKLISLLREVKRLGISVGTVDINASIADASPDFNNKTSFDMLMGFANVSAVSVHNGEIIVQEREKNGDYQSLSDFIERCYKAGITNKTVYKNLANAGAYDSLGINRQSAFFSIDGILERIKNDQKKQGGNESLFDIFDDVIDTKSSDDMFVVNEPEYSYLEKLGLESEMLRTYISAHPLDKITKEQRKALASDSLDDIRSSLTMDDFPYGGLNFNVLGVPSTIAVKNGKGYRRITVTIDDGNGFMNVNIDKGLTTQMTKWEAGEELKRLYLKGDDHIPQDKLDAFFGIEDNPFPALNESSLYVFTINVSRARNGNVYTSITDAHPVPLADNGMLPVRIRFDFKGSKQDKQKVMERMKKLPVYLAEKFPGNTPIVVGAYSTQDDYRATKSVGIDNNTVFEDMLQDMKASPKNDNRKWRPKPTHGNNAYVAPMNLLEKSDFMSYKDTHVNVDISDEMLKEAMRLLESDHDIDNGVTPHISPQDSSKMQRG